MGEIHADRTGLLDLLIGPHKMDLSPVPCWGSYLHKPLAEAIENFALFQ